DQQRNDRVRACKNPSAARARNARAHGDARHDILRPARISLVKRSTSCLRTVVLPAQLKSKLISLALWYGFTRSCTFAFGFVGTSKYSDAASNSTDSGVHAQSMNFFAEEGSGASFSITMQNRSYPVPSLGSDISMGNPLSMLPRMSCANRMPTPTSPRPTSCVGPMPERVYCATLALKRLTYSHPFCSPISCSTVVR